MKYQNKKVVGVWMDKDHANIFRTPDYSNDGDYTIHEKVAISHHGHHGRSEHTGHQKKIQETTKYFRELAVHLNKAEAIYLIGPGQSQEQFKNFLMEEKAFSGVEIELGTADHLSPNQVIAKIRDHFNKP